MDKTQELFANNLKKYRKLREFTQEELSSVIGLSIRGYQKYEQIEAWPSSEVVSKICEVLKISTSDLFEDPNSHTTENSLLNDADMSTLAHKISEMVSKKLNKTDLSNKEMELIRLIRSKDSTFLTMLILLIDIAPEKIINLANALSSMKLEKKNTNQNKSSGQFQNARVKSGTAHS